MLSPQLLQQLNSQINLERYSANLYLQMSAWCQHKGLSGCAAFLRQHAEEERSHMQRLFSYIEDTGELPILEALAAPPAQFQSIKAVFEQTAAHELKVTAAINALTASALQEKDFSTFNFLQWYVAEQHEEEKLFRSLLERIDLIGEQPSSLFLLDREIARLTQERTA